MVEAELDGSLSQKFRDSAVQEVRDAANLLLIERRERHSDETAPRGG